MANIYVATAGAGSQDGSTLANAINGGSQTTLRSTIEGASASDVIRLVEGTYTVTSEIQVPTDVSILGWTTGDAEASSPLAIITGVSGTTYTVNSPDANNVSLFALEPGTSGQVFKHLHCKLFNKIWDADNGRVQDVIIDDFIGEIGSDIIASKGDYHTFTSGNVSAGNDTITTTSHGLSNGDRVRFVRNSTSSSLPGGISEGTEYYVVNVSGSTFKVSNTSGGSAINITSGGSGTNVWYRRATSTPNSQGWQVTNGILRNFSRTGWRIWYGCSNMYVENVECWGDDGTNYQDCTLNSSTDTFTCTNHGFSNNEAVSFHMTTKPSGWPDDEAGRSGQWKLYYVRNATANTFQIATTSGGSAITAFTSSGSGLKVHRTYCLRANAGTAGFDVGYTSAGRHTADKEIHLVNVFGGECSDKSTNASTGSNWQGDLIKTETDTTGSVNGGYAIYCADAGVDCKGTWTIQNFHANHCLNPYKSYASQPERLVLTNCIGLNALWQGGKQVDPRLLSLLSNGFMQCYNCTFFNVEGGTGLTSTYFVAKYITSPSPNNQQVQLIDSLYGFYDAQSTSSLQKLSDGGSTASPTILETRTTWYNDRGVSSPGTDPNFVDNTDVDFIGGNTNWNSQTYGAARGYFYTEPVPTDPPEEPEDPPAPPPPSPPAGNTVIVITGVNMSGVTFT